MGRNIEGNYIVAPRDILFFKNEYKKYVLYEVIGVYLGGMGQDSVAELKPINKIASAEGNQFINPQFVEAMVESGIIKLVDEDKPLISKNT